MLLLISEVFGGVNGRAVRFLTRLAHRARESSDAVYFDRAGRNVSYYTHHARAISRAAAVGHGEVLLQLIAATRTRAAAAREAQRRTAEDAARAGALLCAILPRPPAPLA